MFRLLNLDRDIKLRQKDYMFELNLGSLFAFILYSYKIQPLGTLLEHCFEKRLKTLKEFPRSNDHMRFFNSFVIQ